MNQLIELIPVVFPAIMAVVMVLMVVTQIIVQVLKKATWDKLPTNTLAVIVAVALTVGAVCAGCSIAEIVIRWYILGGAVVLGFFVAFAAMFGFDKFRQTLEQITKLK